MNTTITKRYTNQAGGAAGEWCCKLPFILILLFFALPVQQAVAQTGLAASAVVADKSCDVDPIPCPTCECEDQMVQLSVRYNGPDGVTIQAERDALGDLGTFTGVNDGDIITVYSSTSGDTELKNDTKFRIDGGAEIKFHTSCSDDISGLTINELTVVGWVDKLGNICDIADVIDVCISSTPCECSGGMVEMSILYNGPDGATIESFGNAWGDQGVFTGVNDGDVVVLTAAPGEPRLKNGTLVRANGGTDYEFHASCSQEIGGLVQGNFTCVGWLDADGNSCSLLPPVVCDGAIDLSVSGGTGPYTYAWSNGATTQDLTDLCDGDYTVTISDASGSTITATYSVLDCPPCDPGLLTVTADVVNSVCDPVVPPVCPTCVCEGGMVQLSVRYNGPDGVSIEGQRSSWGDLGTFTANDGDIITVYASTTGDSKLSSSTKFRIDGGVEIDIHTSCSQDINGYSEGGLTVVGWIDDDGNTCDVASIIDDCISPPDCDCSGGMVEMSIQYNGPDGVTIESMGNAWGDQGVFTGVNDGDIIVLTPAPGETELKNGTMVRVNGGTEYEFHASCSQDIIGLSQGGLTAVGFVDNNGSVCSLYPPLPCTGSIDVTVSGGSGMYTYAWDNGATTEDLMNVCAGTYTLTITDNNSCQTTVTYTVGDCGPDVMDDMDTVCEGGSTTTNVLDNDNDPDGNLDPTTLMIVSGPSHGTLTVNPDGTITYTHDGSMNYTDSYVYQVSDMDGNMGTGTVQITIYEAPDVTGVVTDAVCDALGAIDITASGGTAPYTYSWSNGATTEDISGLTAGDYTVTVTDANGCEHMMTFTVSATADLVIANVTVTGAPSCSGSGSVTITLDASASGTGPYSVLINGSYNFGPFASSPITITGAPGGAKITSIVVTDANGCMDIDNGTYMIDQPSVSISAVTSTDADCVSGMGTVTIDIDDSDAGMAPYYVNVNGTISGPYASEPITIAVAPGSYALFAVRDAKDCVDKVNAGVVVNPPTGCVTCPPPTGTVETVNGYHTADLTWNSVFEGTGQYELCIEELGTGIPTCITVNDTTRLVGGLSPCTFYQWCVKTICDGEVSDCTPYRIFITSCGKENSLAGPQSTVFPNPATGSVQLRLESVTSSDVTMEVVSMDGKVMMSKLWSGQTQISAQLDITGYPTGLYLVKWIAGDEVITDRLHVSDETR